MQIESLKVFVDLAERKVLPKPRKLTTSPNRPSASRITSLERLFKSARRAEQEKVPLTREGQVLYDYSKQVIATYDALHSKLQEIKDIISGTVRVGHHLQHWFARFAALPQKVPQSLSHR